MKSKLQLILTSLLALVAGAAQADQYEFELREIPTNRLLASGSMILQKEQQPYMNPPGARFADMTRHGYLKSCTSNGVDRLTAIPGEVESGTEFLLVVPEGDKPPQLQVVHTELEKFDSIEMGTCTVQIPVVRIRFITNAVVSAPMNVWQSFPIDESLVAELRRVN